MNDKVKYGLIDRTGEIHITNEGREVEIIEYINSNNCTIKFEDGITLTKRYYSNIIKGKVKKPKEDINHVGEEHITKQGYKIKITESIKLTASLDKLSNQCVFIYRYPKLSIINIFYLAEE